ncbi:type IX secretion/gliding motility protein PorT/SprT [Myroides pelagicus]|uniref:Outer membrane beta-barrel protein n=1 Tax=Myroides pelagicus TaxID=270914 RepID=A0A7K1GQ98_9FLAO|nr:porin family protein [Myroides pelagicus]MEC4115010.1 porin family protein [Myroides pelagicus]MTH30948.1 outer membrane beta-barrel protein [Myroides pelagicus]
MKKLYILLFFILGTISSFAQWPFGKNPILNKEDWDKQRVHWGYYLGFNSMNYQISYTEDYHNQIHDLATKYPHDFTEIQVHSSTGFNVGLVGNLRLFEYLDLRFEPGLFHAKRTLTYPKVLIYNYYKQEHGNTLPKDQEIRNSSIKEVNSTYIHFPLLLKFSALRTGNIRPYLIGGVSMDLDLGSNSNSAKDNYEGVWRMKKWTANYEIGAGIDIYFHYFKFTPAIKGIFGLGDELIRDNSVNSPWTGGIKSMKKRGVFLSFTFH